jgi:hypothetical protein
VQVGPARHCQSDKNAHQITRHTSHVTCLT